MNTMHHTEATQKFEAFVRQLTAAWQREMDEPLQQWNVPPHLSAKVNEDGTLNDFFGYTTVIPLSVQDRASCEQAQALLLERLGDYLVPLLPETFHMTIHALANERNTAGGADAVQQWMQANEQQIHDTFTVIAERSAGRKIAMRALGVSTSNNDVISIRYVPEAEEDYQLLLDIYNRIAKLSPEQSSYRPHVSLVYFKLQPLAQEQIARLYETMDEMNRTLSLDVVLEVDRLAVQSHDHMNRFPTLYTIADLQKEDHD
ncbi:hypothetical protein [Paenibacillus campi]|uniref:hypothetical protein n=1 Tax=Paenibacillus campi TaxID=3106031 RepID=UPI002AFE6A2E|nr:hypothetical protein [Paenibacillus sp. SGZ-1014]